MTERVRTSFGERPGDGFGTLPPASCAMMARALALRGATAGDQPFRRALYGFQRASEFAAVAWPEAMKQHLLDDQFRLQSRHYALHHPTADRLIVTRAARAIGRLDLDRGASTWRLLELALLPDDQGAGIGTVLIGWVLAAATSAGAAEVDLHVAADNRRAQAFYRRLGFTDRPGAGPSHLRLARPVPPIS